MIRTWFGLATLMGLVLFLVGCNIFRDAIGVEADSADEHILEGQILIRKSNYPGALAQFETAIKKNSSKSEAYYGAAKCALLQQHINMFQLMQSFQENDGKSIPFLSEPDSIKDKIFVANRGINKYLGTLVELDRKGKSDGKISTRQFSGDYALASAIEAVLSLADFNGDGRINAKDNILNGIIDFSDPSQLNPESIMANIADLKNDTVKIAALNDLLDKSAQLLAKSGKAIDLFLTGAVGQFDTTSCATADTTCQKLKEASGVGKEQVGDSAITQVKKFIQDAGSTVVIYKVFDKVDNDGDGCIDEELLDGIDNDGDSRVDEDSRGAPDTVGNVNFYADKDKADNDMDGKSDLIDAEGDETQFHARYLLSLKPMELAVNPNRRGQIFWASGTLVSRDTRRQELVVLDSLVTPKLIDTVITFDLCKGSVLGFKKGK